MTVPSEVSSVSYSGNGTTTVFAIPFYFLENSHIKVILRSSTGSETTWVINVDYTLTGAGVQAGGTLTATVAPATGTTLVISRSVPATQETDYPANDPFPSSSHERALDKLTMIVQQNSSGIKGAIRVPDTDPEPARLPTVTVRADKLLSFDASGNPIAVAAANQSATDLELRLANVTDPLKGAALIGFLQSGTGAVGRTVLSKLRDVVSVKDFGAIGDGVADDTSAIQAAINAVAVNQGYQTTLGAVTGGFVSNIASLWIPRGVYKITSALVCPAYFKVLADNAVIIQNNASLDIFSGTAAYQWEIEGVHFSGGRHHALLQNANTDVTRWMFTHCTFSLSGDFAVKTFPTGGATSHLSANLSIKQCAFYKPKKILLNYCDSAIVEDSWVFVSKDNFTASTSVFENGSLTTDGYPNLYLRNMFGVPSMGTQGVDRLANVRWCDLFKGAIYADACRFGGEFAGMPIVYNMSVPVTTYPYRGHAVVIQNSECFAGPSAANDSGIVSLQGQIPQRIVIRGNSGPVEVPYITNAGTQIADITTYLNNFQTASGQKIYEQFQFEIQHNGSLAPNGVVYGERVPAGLRPYCNNFRQTKIRRTTTQVITNAFASNIISFDTVDLDTQGGFAIANPTRIVMPAGATRMRIEVYFSLDGGWTGNTLRAAIITSGLAVVAGQGFASNINSDDTQYTLSVDVDGIPGTFWHLELKQNATGSQNMTKATVTTTALDYIH